MLSKEQEIKNTISDKQRIIEILLVIFSGILKFIFVDFLNYRLPFIVMIIIFWSVYIYCRYYANKNILYYWGFRKDNFFQVFKLMIPLSVIALIASISIGLFQNTIHLSWHMIPLFLLYPIWGILQHFLMIAMFSSNCSDFKSVSINKNLIVFMNAILFSSVHYPNKWLMIGTFFLAIYYGYVYLKSRNLYVLGIFHGWLAVLFYYTVVNKDPFLEVFGKILK